MTAAGATAPIEQCRVIHAEQVQDALAHLYDYARLGRHPLAKVLAGPPGSAGLTGRALHQRLVDAVTALAREPGPRQTRSRAVLRLRYVEGLDVADVCRQLGIGRSEFYREHRAGLSELVDSIEQTIPPDAAGEVGGAIAAGAVDASTGPAVRSVAAGTSIQQAATTEATGRSQAATTETTGRSQSAATEVTGRDQSAATGMGGGGQDGAASSDGGIESVGHGRDRTPLPAPLTRLIGRAAEVADLECRLAEHRLVTLTGAGGAGKTRLAVAVASRLADRFVGGVVFIDLASVGDARLVPAVVAAGVGIRDPGGRPIEEVLVAALDHEPSLMVLDNCEHLVDATARLTEALLRACPDLRVLATSREVLGIAGEVAWRVPSLQLPPEVDAVGSQRARSDVDDGSALQLPAEDEVAVAEAARYGAVQLFVERAALLRPGFALTAANVGIVVDLCRRLDGMPLAIELAAARLRVLTVEQLAGRIDDRFRLLTGGSRTALRRQQTLRAAIDWSHDLLTDPERRLLRRLAVFAGGWTLEAAEAICADADMTPDTVLDLLTGLVDKSLVQIDPGAESCRYRLLETLRQYAAEKLVDAGEAAAVRDRHLAWYLALAEPARIGLTGPDQLGILNRLELEQANLRVALDWAGTRDDDRAVRLAVALSYFWDLRGRGVEALDTLGRLARRAEAAPIASPSDRASVLYWLARFARATSTWAEARELATAAVAAARACGDARTLSLALSRSGWLASQRPDGELSKDLDEAVAVARVAGDRWATAAALQTYGSISHLLGDFAGARPLLEEARALGQVVGDRAVVAQADEFLAVNAYFRGDLEAATQLLQASLTAWQALGGTIGVARIWRNQARVAIARGEVPGAEVLLRRSLVTFRRAGVRTFVAFCLEGLAGAAAVSGRPGRALRLVGAASRLREQIGWYVPPGELSELESWLTLARQSLDETAAGAAWAEGLRMSVDEAMAYAEQDVDAHG